MTPPWWRSPDDVRTVHSFFEIGALALFAALVIFEILEHLKIKGETAFKILALVSFGLAVLFEICAYPYSKRNDELSGNEIRRLSTAAESARTQAAKAEAEIAHLTARFAPRILTDVQIRDISGELRRFSGQGFTALVASESSESLTLLNQIGRTLDRATWKYFKAESWHPILIGDGILISRHPDADQQTKDAADGLVKALSSRGFAAELRKVPEIVEHNAVIIQVNAKPPTK